MRSTTRPKSIRGSSKAKRFRKQIDLKAHQPDLSQSKVAYLRIEEMIIGLKLKPGEWLSEAGLSDLLGIGRTPIREALQQLARDNLVEILYRKGTIVKEIDAHKQMEFLEVRKPLEHLLVRRAAQRATSDQRTTFLKISREFNKASFMGDFPAAMSLTRDYYIELYRASRQQVLEQSLTPLVSVSRTFFFRNSVPKEMQAAGKLHSDLAANIAKGAMPSVDSSFLLLFKYLGEFCRAKLELR